MRHKAKIDFWIAVAMLGGILAPLLGRAYWVSGTILLAFLILVFPQSYETTPDGRLRVTAAGFPLLDAIVADLAA